MSMSHSGISWEEKGCFNDKLKIERVCLENSLDDLILYLGDINEHVGVLC